MQAPAAAEADPTYTYRAEKQLEQQVLKVVAQNLQKNPVLAAESEVPFRRVAITAVADDSEDLDDVLCRLDDCTSLRHKYEQVTFQGPGQNPMDHRVSAVIDGQTPPFSPFEEPMPADAADKLHFKQVDGVFLVFKRRAEGAEQDDDEVMHRPPSVDEFYHDLRKVVSIVSDGPVKSFAFRRLALLESKFEMHRLLNDAAEKLCNKKVPHRDFYNVRKVDTHVHLASCMNQKHLLRFIKAKLRKSGNDIVIFRDNQHLTLEQVFESLGITAQSLSIDTLDMHAHQEAFHRFDKFNLKYNPMGSSRLREIFLKTDNYIGGRYFAELIKEVMKDLEDSKYQMAEYRVSIYGRSRAEWTKLAKWIVSHRVFSPNVRWLIQMPRLYSIYKRNGDVSNFGELLDNFFQPLFEATVEPSRHPELSQFLQHVVGFDSVDDESRPTGKLGGSGKVVVPAQWDGPEDPPYSYYLHYMASNLATLNQLRASRGLNTFQLRPHCGEAGNEALENLAVAFLVAKGIAHGILLRKVPALQYLYYIAQVPLYVSPLSNNALFLSFDRNPFPTYFRRGLNVSLSTDDPLQFHYTREPLMEEYSIAAQIWRLSGVDMCELAAASVRGSGWEKCIKRYWVGDGCDGDAAAAPAAHDESPAETAARYMEEMQKTNVPWLRREYRKATLAEEKNAMAAAKERENAQKMGRRGSVGATLHTMVSAVALGVVPEVSFASK